MARAIKKLLLMALLAGASGCWSHVDVLPWMDIPPYRDPPAGFSSSYHRALYGPRPPRPVAPLEQAKSTTDHPAGSHVPPTNENGDDGVRVLGHESQRDRDVADPTEDRPIKPRRPSFASRFDFLFRPPRPIRF